MLIAAGGKGGSGNLAQAEEILTGSLLPSLPKPVKNNGLVVGTDSDGKNKVCYVLSLLIWLNNNKIHVQAFIKLYSFDILNFLNLTELVKVFFLDSMLHFSSVWLGPGNQSIWGCKVASTK